MTLGAHSEIQDGAPERARPRPACAKVGGLTTRLERPRTASRDAILVVEDDDDIRNLLAEILTEEGYTIREAANGRDALAAARSDPPALILLDLMMPVMDGWEFRERQKDDPLLAGIPVVAVSAALSAVERYGLDVDRFLPKPMDIEALLDAVRELIASREAGASAPA